MKLLFHSFNYLFHVWGPLLYHFNKTLQKTFSTCPKMLFNYESNKRKLSTKVQNKVSKNGITFQYSSFCRGDSSFCTSHFFSPHPTYLGHETITMKHVSHSETLPYTKGTEKKKTPIFTNPAVPYSWSSRS